MTASQRSVTVGEAMTSRVRTATPDESLPEIWLLLGEEGCHHVPIVDGGLPVGMVSSRDLVRLAHRKGASKLDARALAGATASDVMSRELETIDADAPIEAAIDRIGRGDLHALVVVDEDGALVGIVTHNDLLHYLFS